MVRAHHLALGCTHDTFLDLRSTRQCITVIEEMAAFVVRTSLGSLSGAGRLQLTIRVLDILVSGVGRGLKMREQFRFGHGSRILQP